MHDTVQTSTPSATIHFMPSPAAAYRPAGAPAPTRCSECHNKDLCLAAGLSAHELEQVEGLQFARRRVKAGEPLYHAGQKFGFLYAVRSGTFKTVVTLRDGREQVTGFRMAGELMGLDGVAQGTYATAAIPLEDCEICAIPWHQLAELAARNTSLQTLLRRIMSSEIVREHQLMMMLGSMNAEERVASFLLNMSARMKARRYSPSEFHLRMSRAEIGSYLGMKLETVSRTFSAFQAQGLLKVDKKHIRILDLQALEESSVRVH